MSYAPPTRSRNVLSQVHRVIQDGGRITSYLEDFTDPDKVLYTGLLGGDYGRFGFRGSELTECTKMRVRQILPKTVHRVRI